MTTYALKFNDFELSLETVFEGNPGSRLVQSSPATLHA